MTRGFILALILLAGGATDINAQQPVPRPTPTPSEDDVVKITTNLVQVDVVVTDESGKRISNLTADDFEVRENGRPQKITNLSFVSATPPTAAPPANTTGKVVTYGPPVRLRAPDVRRTVALVVDDLCLSWTSANYVRKALRKFVAEQMQPGDLVAIIRTAGSIGILQQFTSDKDQLHAAIDRVKWVPRMCDRTEAFDQLNESLQLPTLGLGPIDPNGSLAASGKVAEKKDLEDINTRGGKSNAADFRNETVTVGTLGALSQIVRGLKELPGRKAVLFISDGFRLVDKAGPKGEIDAGYTRRVLEAIERVADLAGRSSVAVYTLDARGLVAPNITAADQVSGSSVIGGGAAFITARAGEINDTQAGLSYLANQAGGFAIYNTNDLTSGIKRVFDDQSGYYLIGYRPDEETFDAKTGRNKFHKISVKVKRPGLSVRTRTGFYGVSEDQIASAPVSRAQPLVQAVISPFTANGIDVRLTSVFMNDAQAGSYLRSLLHIDPKDLTFTDEADGWKQTKIDVMAVTFGDNGAVVDQVNKTQTLSLRGETYRRTLRDGLVYFLNVPVKKAGAYQFRIAVRDNASNQIGSAGQFVHVPDVRNDRLALSGLVVTGNAPTTAQVADAKESVSDTQTSAAVRRFTRGMTINYALAVYNPTLSKTTQRPDLEIQFRLFKDGQVVMSGQPTGINTSGQANAGQILTSGAFPLGAELGPGEYFLQAIVRDRLAKDRNTAMQWIDFEIMP